MNDYILAFRLLDQFKVRGFTVVVRTHNQEWEVRVDKGLIGFHTWGQLPNAIIEAYKNVSMVYDQV